MFLEPGPWLEVALGIQCAAPSLTGDYLSLLAYLRRRGAHLLRGGPQSPLRDDCSSESPVYVSRGMLWCLRLLV